MKLLLALIFLVFASFVMAVPAAPSPECRMISEVREVQYQEARQTTPESLCRGRTIGAYYAVKVFNNAAAGNTDNAELCAQIYPAEQELLVTVSIEDMQNKTLEQGQRILGTVHFAGDECHHADYLTDYGVFSPEPLQRLNILQRFWHWLISLFR